MEGMFLQIGPTDFHVRWQECYPGTVPLGYRMRVSHAQRWLRIHSLPDGKRYAKSAAEETALLARQNRAADLVLGERATVALLGYDYTGRHILPTDHPLRGFLSPDARPLMRVASEYDDTPEISIFGALRTWRSGDLDELLLGVANDRLRLILLAWDTGAAFIPYDGGVDLFFPSPDERERIRPALTDWLSRHPEGL